MNNQPIPGDDPKRRIPTPIPVRSAPPTNFPIEDKKKPMPSNPPPRANIYLAQDNQNQYQNAIQMGHPFLKKQPNDPRNENFCEMLKFACCPSFRFLTFIFIISCFDICLYLISLVWGLSKESFIAPKESSLEKLGAVDRYKMKHDFELQRFVAPLVLHASLLDLLIDVFIQIMIGSVIEKIFGTWRIAVIYFVAGIAGILMLVIVVDAIYVGSDPSIAGMMGAFLGYIILNWKALDFPGSPRCFIVGFTLVFIIILLIQNAIPVIISVFIGAVLGLLLAQPLTDIPIFEADIFRENNFSRNTTNMKIIAGIILGIYFVIATACFFLP